MLPAMRNKPLVLLMALAIASIVAVGCGGGDDETSGSLTKAEFVEQGNAICAKYNKQIEEEFQEFTKESGGLNSQAPEAVKKEIARISLAALEPQLEELRSLPAPSGDEEKVNLILERQEKSIEIIEEEPAFRTSGNPFEELNKPASDYGLVECSV